LSLQIIVLLTLIMMESENIHTKSKTMRGTTIGIVVVLAGLLLLLTNFGLVTEGWKHIFFSWQMLLIVIGVISLLSYDSWIPGIILVCVGSFFLLPRLFFLPDQFMHNFWPLILIAAGVMIIFKICPHRSVRAKNDLHERSVSSEGMVHEEVIFSDSTQHITSQEFSGGQVHCVFGNIELDLTQARLAEGSHTLNLSIAFGGITVIVPPSWKVEMKMSSILGGFADKRVTVKEKIDPTRSLIIRGSAVFGGGEIKSY